MEPHQSHKTVKTVVLVIFAVLLLLYWSARTLHSVPLSHFVQDKIPLLELRLRFVNMTGEEVAPNSAPFGGQAEGQGMATSGCPEWVGGDTRAGTSVGDSSKKRIDTDCPRRALWYVRRHPIALSLHFADGKKVLALFEKEGGLKTLFKTKFVQGIFYNLLNSANVRAEELRLEGLKGAFFSKFIKEAIKAHADLHYDVAHGKKGFVFSFIRDECPFASKALPIMARRLARSGYRVPGLEEPILDMRIGLQHLFITQYKERVYLSNGLETLLNVIESLPPSSKELDKMPLTLTMRAEAFLDKVPPLLSDTPGFEVCFGFSLSPESPGILRFPSGKYVQFLRPKITKGVLASIPHDVFAALVTSFQLPPGMSDEDWQNLATHGPPAIKGDVPQESGFAILWDLNAQENKITDIGIILSNPNGFYRLEEVQHYFKNAELTGACGGGMVFVAATSQNLFSRMRECCEGQSLSILDWERGTKLTSVQTAQMLVFANPGAGLRELFLAGGAKSDDLGEFEPRWKQEYEDVKRAIRLDGEKTFLRIPIFAYSGQVTSTVTPVELKGFTVNLGGQK